MNTVKKILCLLLALAMLLSVAACGQEAAEEKKGSEEGSKTPSGEKKKDEASPEFVYKATVSDLKDSPLSNFYATLTTKDGFYCFTSEVVGQRELSEGEVLEYEGQLDIYDTVLYRLGFDGSLVKLDGYKPIRLDAEEGHQVSSSANSMAPMADGGFLVWENAYEYWSEAGEGVELYSDEWYQYYQYREHNYLRKLDENGAEISCVELDLEELLKSQDYVYFNGMAALGDNKALMAGENGLYIFDTETGKMTGTVSGIDWTERLLSLNDGRVAVVYYGEAGYRLSVVDPDKLELGESWNVQGELYNAVVGGGDYDIYYNNGVNFFGYDLETGQAEKLFNWINCDVDNSNLNSYAVTDDGKVVAVSVEWDDRYENSTISVITMEKVPADSVPQKETITLACQYLDWQARKQIIKFNRSHDNVRIELRDYSEYNTEEDYEAGLTKLRTEILAGNCPDILDLGGLPAKQLAAKGLLTDLYPFLDADPELSREDFFPSVLHALENEGKLYSTADSFYVITAVGPARIVGDKPGWTYADLMAALREMPEGCSVFSQTETRADILQLCLSLEMDRFVNWNTGEVNFDCPEFIDLLNFAKTFPAEFDWEHYEWSEEDNDSYRVREGKQLLIYDYISGFDSLVNYENIYGGLDAFTYIGFPTSSGVGSLMNPNQGYAICESCSNKEAAWEFVRIFLTEEYQNDNVYNIPSNIHSYEKKKADAMTETYYKDENGKIMIDPMTGEKMKEEKGGYWDDVKNEWVPIYSYSEAEIGKVESAIMSAERVYVRDEAIYNIVMELVEGFFSGQRSAEDVAKLIQSKVRIYVNEQR